MKRDVETAILDIVYGIVWAILIWLLISLGIKIYNRSKDPANPPAVIGHVYIGE